MALTGGNMPGMRTSLRHLGAGVLATASLLLAGCFMDNDGKLSQDIRSNAAYPLKVGQARLCFMDQSRCLPLRIRKYKSAGYGVFFVEDDKEIDFFMRPLAGPGIPAGTYVTLGEPAGQGHVSEYYQLGLATRQSDGSWLVLKPECDYAKEPIIKEKFYPWVWTSDAGTLVCMIGTEGLTDERVYRALKELTSQGEQFRLFEGT